MSNLWDQNQGFEGGYKESDRHYQRFAEFVKLGPKRSGSAVARILGVSPQVVNYSLQRFSWVSRAAAWDEHFGSVANPPDIGPPLSNSRSPSKRKYKKSIPKEKSAKSPKSSKEPSFPKAPKTLGIKPAEDSRKPEPTREEPQHDGKEVTRADMPTTETADSPFMQVEIVTHKPDLANESREHIEELIEYSKAHKELGRKAHQESAECFPIFQMLREDLFVAISVRRNLLRQLEESAANDDGMQPENTETRERQVKTYERLNDTINKHINPYSNLSKTMIDMATFARETWGATIGVDEAVRQVMGINRAA